MSPYRSRNRLTNCSVATLTGWMAPAPPLPLYESASPDFASNKSEYANGHEV